MFKSRLMRTPGLNSCIHTIRAQWTQQFGLSGLQPKADRAHYHLHTCAPLATRPCHFIMLMGNRRDLLDFSFTPYHFRDYLSTLQRVNSSICFSQSIFYISRVDSCHIDMQNVPRKEDQFEGSVWKMA